MTTIRLMHAKLHQVRVTRANPDYMGSVTIDQRLMEQVGIFPLEEVQIYNSQNGHRFSTYVLPGETGSGCIEINGAASHLCGVGDAVIIVAFAQRDRAEVIKTGHQATVFISNAQNQCQELLVQQVIPNFAQERLDFQSESVLKAAIPTEMEPLPPPPPRPPIDNDPDEMLDRGVESPPSPNFSFLDPPPPYDSTQF
ncbi:aspartate 1-decarboxylase [Spirulina subsalsa FACHB-351]|uniref:Aspartate 1-decarboxylase n=1 Tax=Spirulina subsalsa FACHB-351 TaxID=234711 RepID=A0ABT3LBK5_9CYAN|nr:aspartate 1-decarboxylase [Spirulina subsalsa]MCW6038469.1 aspartate 1-decarboxylase [Spirulina subsalsa FACHB-351]